MKSIQWILSVSWLSRVDYNLYLPLVRPFIVLIIVIILFYYQIKNLVVSNKYYYYITARAPTIGLLFLLISIRYYGQPSTEINTCIIRIIVRSNHSNHSNLYKGNKWQKQRPVTGLIYVGHTVLLYLLSWILHLCYCRSMHIPTLVCTVQIYT